MARTRAQERAEEQGIKPSPPQKAKSKPTPAKKGAPKGGKSEKKKAETAQKRQHSETEEPTATEDEPKEAKLPTPKKAKPAAETNNRDVSSSNATIQKLLSTYGILPLQDLGLDSPTSATPDTILALVLNAMLTSARISHELAHKSVKRLIEAGYHKVDTLKNSSWEERTRVLTEGGYTRYREKTATALGDLAELVEKEYDGDLNKIVSSSSSDPTKIRAALKEIKGLGDVGVNIFFDSAQSVWPCVAPYIDPRSLDTAKQLGLGNDVDKIYEEVGKSPAEMCKLSSALTTVRLEKKVNGFK